MSQFQAGSGIRDNHSRGTVASFLMEKIQDGATLSIVSAYFTIYAYDALKQSLEPFHVQALITQAPVKAFDEPILDRTARADKA